MKKNLATLALVSLLAMGMEGNAQWNLTGNNNATTSSILGTTNAVRLNLATKATTRMVIDTLGRVGIGTTNPINALTVQGSGSAPASSWVSNGSPLFVGFAENTAGNADFNLMMASSAAANARGVMGMKRSRGTLATPTAVLNNDQLGSLLISGFDGTNFQGSAAVDFFADGTPTAGNVPTRISFVTGTNGSNRTERMKIGNTGDITINTNQLTVTRATGDVNIGAGNLLLAKKANIKGIVGVNGDTLAGTALMVNANANFNGLAVSDPVNKYVLYAAKSGTNQGIYVTKSSNTSTNGCIVGQSTGTSPGLEGYSKKGNGVYAQSDSSAAVYAVSNTQNGLYAQTNSGLKFAGYFNGDVFSTGAYTGSDARLKSNINDVTNAMQIIGLLQPKNYTFNRAGDYANLQLPQGLHYGLIAQDLEKVLPNLVKEANVSIKTSKTATAEGEQASTVNFKSVNYTELIPIMIKGMQEQQAIIQQQNEKINALIAMVEKLSPDAKTAATAIQLNSALLDQNYPNPPAGNTTTIGYNIPKGAAKAQLIITDNLGRNLKTINLTNTGKGQLNLNTTGLNAGTYTYTMVIDGKTTASKKMIVTGN